MNTMMPAAQPRGQTEILCPTHVPTPHGVDRWELLTLVTSLRQDLGLADRDIMVLRAHLTVLPHGPLDLRRLNVSFMSVTEILTRACGMDERRFRRGEARLEQAGLILRRLSGNGRRFPERDRTGQIVSAYGIDLAPVIAQYGDLLALAARRDDQQRALRQRKNSLSARLSAAVRTALATGATLPVWVVALRDRLRRVVRRKTPNIEALDALEDDVEQVEKLTANQLNHTDAEESPDNPAADDGQTVRRIESVLKDKNKNPTPNFDVRKIKALWTNTKTICDFYPDSPNHEREATTVFYQLASFMQIDPKLVAQALAVMGWENTLVVLDYLAGKCAAIRKPTAYLILMINRYENGAPVAGGQVNPRRSAPLLVSGLPG